MWPALPFTTQQQIQHTPSNVLFRRRNVRLQACRQSAVNLTTARARQGLAQTAVWPNSSCQALRKAQSRSHPQRAACIPSQGAGSSANFKFQATPKPSDFMHNLQKASRRQLRKLDGLWGRFIPMVSLFFMMAFINTILDSLANSLVITAVGGGTEVIPFLTVYGVLPFSVLFLVAYSFATQRFSRATLFNITVSIFLALYAGFALLYPHHEAVHLHGFAAHMLERSPAGFAGLIGMIRNWMFTLFYCTSELWGDVVLSLLFWGLANETTSMRNAPVLYPLFGVGANVAQTLAGRLLSAFSNTAASSHMPYARQVQVCMVLVLMLGLAILALHHYINIRFPHNYPSLPEPLQGSVSQPVSGSDSTARGMQSGPSQNGASSSNSAGTSSQTSAGAHHRNGSNSHASSNGSSHSNSSSSTSPAKQQSPNGGRSKLGFKDAVRFLAKSPQIRCLAMMALAQGLSTNLLDVAWKQHLHMLHPSPAAYSAFMGEVAMWTGVVTGSLMFASPILFDRLGWRGVAGATPTFMLFAGMPFFAGVSIYAFMSLDAVAPPAPVVLKALVIVGAIIQVFAKGAKFSMFKPAEEMVYIGLDQESRTKGKAAIDVVGAQSGKSAGSVLQQVLLVISGGTNVARLPIMSLAFFVMLRSWLRSVKQLATFSNCSMTHVEDTMEETAVSNIDGFTSTDDTDVTPAPAIAGTS